jgi:predicted Zn-dependent protease
MVTKRLMEIANETVQFALENRVDQVQAASFFVDSALTRYANSLIHQNVASKRGGIQMKVVIGKRLGTLRANSLEKTEIERSVRKAVSLAKVTPPNKDFKSLPKPQRWTQIRGTFDRKTAECTADFRADQVKEAIDVALSESDKVNAVAGYYYTGTSAYAVANSLGVSASAKISSASMQTTVISKSGNSQGFSSEEEHSRQVDDIDPVSIGSKAAKKSLRSLDPGKIPIGNYEVVLSPRAVAGLITYLGYIGFSATSYQDGQSFIKYNLDKQIFDSELNVMDNPRDTKTLYSFPIDGEGVPKKKMQLIRNGEVSEKSICYDSFTAGKEGKKSTGHALPPIYGYYGRPFPLNIVVKPGDSTIGEMVEETKRGVYVTRFHYTNPVEPTKAILTGLTRDGTFLIESGEMTKPVKNLRYTDSMLSALKEAPMFGRDLEIVEKVTAPAMKLAKLRFTGITEH